MTSSPARTSRPTVHLGFLHTSPSHVRRFGELVDELGRGLVDEHGDGPSAGASWLVDEDLLDRARRGVPDAELADALRARLARLAAEGAQVVVCTCSTLGTRAEEVGRLLGIRVLRVDGPMADRAVRTAPAVQGAGVRILVVAALDSTVGPTTGLLRASARRAGTTIEVELLRCDDAWPLFEEGRVDEFADAVAAAVERSVGTARAPSRPDVVVLAQASMAPAADRLSGLGVPVLTSPREAVRHALDAAFALSQGGGTGAVSG